MVEDLRQELDRLNELLRGVTPYRLGIRPPGDFIAAPLNAHHMRKNLFDQLVANIKQDGNLSTLPFCWHTRDGQVHILSGHHRIDAARAASIPAVLYLYTDEELDEERRLAIQISHNSLVGEDDLSILKQQWESLRSLNAKLYSGLDDEHFKVFQPVELRAFTERDLTFTRIELLFVPAEVERLQAVLSKIARSSHLVLLGLEAQYAPLAEAMMRLKLAANILNNSAVFLLMTRLTELYCDLLDAGASEGLTPPWETIVSTLAQEGFHTPAS